MEINTPFIQDRGGEKSNSHVQNPLIEEHNHLLQAELLRVKLLKELFNAISAV